MFIALALYILFGLGIGIWATTSRRAEKVVIPIVDILHTPPIHVFFPFVIYIIVAAIPGYIGINAALIFLIITSMLWNIIFVVYESVKELPHEFIELTAMYGMGLKEKLSKIYISKHAKGDGSVNLVLGYGLNNSIERFNPFELF